MCQIRFSLLVAVFLAGCATSTTAPLAPRALSGTGWVATELASSEMGKRTTPRLEFVSTTAVRGTGGCNTFRGKAVLSETTARFGPLAATRRMCPGVTMQSEDRFFRALEETRALHAENDQLVLVDTSGNVLLRLSPAK